VRPLIEQLNDIFLKLSTEQEFNSVDENMAPYYGRHSTKQFIRGKPVRFGYKFWCGCLPNRFTVWFEPYGGKSTSTADKELGVGGNVVMTSLQKIFRSLFRDILSFLPFHAGSCTISRVSGSCGIYISYVYIYPNFPTGSLSIY
jgi:hypothetical protein